MTSVRKNIRLQQSTMILVDTLQITTGKNFTQLVEDALKLYAKETLTPEQGEELLIKMYEAI